MPSRRTSARVAIAMASLGFSVAGCHKDPILNDANNAPIRGANLLIRSATNEEMCIDIRADRESLHPLLQLSHCSGREPQRWTFAEQNDASIQILGSGGQCMDLQGAHTSSGTPLQLYPCSAAKNQRFRHNIDGRLQEVETGKCLTVNDFVDKSPLFIDTCDEKFKGQVWVITPR